MEDLTGRGVECQKIAASPAVNTNPAAVTAIPATIGWDVSRRHRTTPVSASTAVIQPLLRSSLSPKAFAEPRKGLPASKTGAFVSSFTVLHQSMLLTKTRFASGEKAGPVPQHSSRCSRTEISAVGR